MIDLADLLAALDQVPADRLPEAIGRLEAAKARAWARLTTPAPVEPCSAMGDGAALDVGEAARRLGVSRQWIYRQVRAGHLPFARRIGRRLVFDQTGLARCLARRQTR